MLRLAPRPHLVAAAIAVLAAAAGCTDGAGPRSLGQLRVRPVFAPGEEPATLGVSLTAIRMVLTRADGGVVADTSLPYVVGETTSWLVELDHPPESVGITADLGQGGAIMYTGAGAVSLAEGIGPSSTDHDLLVRYVTGPVAPFSVQVTPDSARFQFAGETRQFTAEVRDSSGMSLTGFSFTWTSSLPGVATVDAAGLVTAVAPGRAYISAGTGGSADSAVVIVAPPTPASLVISPDSAFISLGGSFRFRAVVRDAVGDSLVDVVPSWSSVDVQIATVSDSGVATAVSPGRTRIIARLDALADTAILAVSDGDDGSGIVTIEVTPPQATLASLGATQQFTAVARNAQGIAIPGVTFHWSSSATNIATVSATGLATATGGGSTVISAAADSVTGSASLTVSLGTPVRVIVIPPVATIPALGSTQQFTALAFDAAGSQVTGLAYTWATSNSSVAPIDANGLVTGVATGFATISATTSSVTTGILRGEATVNVIQVVQSVTVSPPSAQLVKGESRQFTATARDGNGHIIPDAVFTWNTLDTGIAGVSGTGVVTALDAGNTAVRATSNGVIGSSSLSVVIVGSVEILGDEEQHVGVGGSLQLVAVVRDPAGVVLNGVTVTWSVEKPGIASVTQTGLVTGLLPGLTLVRATAGGMFGQVWIVVQSAFP